MAKITKPSAKSRIPSQPAAVIATKKQGAATGRETPFRSNNMNPKVSCRLALNNKMPQRMVGKRYGIKLLKNLSQKVPPNPNRRAAKETICGKSHAFIVSKPSKPKGTLSSLVTATKKNRSGLSESVSSAHRSVPPALSRKGRNPGAVDSDDDCDSVESAILEEDICFKCGVSTANMPSWSTLLLCDICDGEYHLACVGLDGPPRSGWRCQRCIQESAFFLKMKYEVAPYFKAPRRPPSMSLCYSPSKPLSEAWKECQTKGFMVVQRIFPLEVLKELTHSRIEGVTKSGRLTGLWQGALDEIKTKLKLSCENLTDRTGRFDLKLPSFVVESLSLEERLKPILQLLRSVMGLREPCIRTHNVVFVPCGSEAQPWHYDDSVRMLNHRRYFTILIPLNPIDENSGGTEIWDDYSNKTDLIRPRPGDAFVFHGSLRHRGCGNNGKTHRLFYYASYSCGTDDNVGM